MRACHRMYRLFAGLVLAMPILAWAAVERVESSLPIPEYSVRPDPRDCAAFPQCGGYFLYEINGAAAASDKDLCTADFPFAGYVARCMCQLDDGSLAEIFPSCDKPVIGNIEPDPDYKEFYMLLLPSCEQ